MDLLKEWGCWFNRVLDQFGLILLLLPERFQDWKVIKSTLWLGGSMGLRYVSHKDTTSNTPSTSLTRQRSRSSPTSGMFYASGGELNLSGKRRMWNTYRRARSDCAGRRHNFSTRLLEDPIPRGDLRIFRCRANWIAERWVSTTRCLGNRFVIWLSAWQLEHKIRSLPYKLLYLFLSHLQQLQ